MRDTYPFSAIVGQERMKRALVLNAINPQIGGVLIRGDAAQPNLRQLAPWLLYFPTLKS